MSPLNQWREALRDSTGLTVIDRRIGFALGNVADSRGLARPGVFRLTKETDTSPRAVRIALRRLENLGFLRCHWHPEQGQQGKATIWELTLPAHTEGGNRGSDRESARASGN